MTLRKVILCFLIVFIFSVGCSSKATLEFDSIADHKDVVEESEYGKISMEFLTLDGENIRSFSAKPDKVYEFDYDYLVTKGNIKLQFRDSDDHIINEIVLSEEEYISAKEEIEKETEGAVEVHEFGRSVKVKSRDHRLKIYIIGSEASGKLNIIW